MRRLLLNTAVLPPSSMRSPQIFLLRTSPIHMARSTFIAQPKSLGDAMNKTNPIKSPLIQTMINKFGFIRFLVDHAFFVAGYQLFVQFGIVGIVFLQLKWGMVTMEQLGNAMQSFVGIGAIKDLGTFINVDFSSWADVKTCVYTEGFVWPEAVPRFFPEATQKRLDEIFNSMFSAAGLTHASVAYKVSSVTTPIQLLFALFTAPFAFRQYKKLPLHKIPVVRRFVGKPASSSQAAGVPPPPPPPAKGAKPVPRPRSFSHGAATSDAAPTQKKQRGTSDLRSSL